MVGNSGATFKAREVPSGLLSTGGDIGVPRVHTRKVTRIKEFALSQSTRSKPCAVNEAAQFHAQPVSRGVYKPFVPRPSSSTPTRPVSPRVLRRRSSIATQPTKPPLSFKTQSSSFIRSRSVYGQGVPHESKENLENRRRLSMSSSNRCRSAPPGKSATVQPFSLRCEDRLKRRRAFEAERLERQKKREQEEENIRRLREQDEMRLLEEEFKRHAFKARPFRKHKRVNVVKGSEKLPA